MDIRECVSCPARGVPDKVYRRTAPAARKGLKRIVARGLCAACYMAAKRSDTLIDFERATAPRDLIREEWEHLADPHRPIKAECLRLAPQFGMNWRTLERAIYRAGVRSQAVA